MCNVRNDVSNRSNQLSAVTSGQLASSNEKLRRLNRRVYVWRNSKSWPDDLLGTLESPGWRVSWRSIASVSGQTPWWGLRCPQLLRADARQRPPAIGTTACHPPGWNHQCTYTLTVTRCFNTPVSFSLFLSVSCAVSLSVFLRLCGNQTIDFTVVQHSNRFRVEMNYLVGRSMRARSTLDILWPIYTRDK